MRRGDLLSLYSQFKGKVIVSLDASGYRTWFIELLKDLSHQVCIGEAPEIRKVARRRRKNDRRDEALTLDCFAQRRVPADPPPLICEPQVGQRRSPGGESS
jgi:hypothetical protein